MGNPNSDCNNNEGYVDLTACQALKNVAKEDGRFRKLLHTIFYLCELAGYRLEGRIVLVDKETGKIWK